MYSFLKNLKFLKKTEKSRFNFIKHKCAFQYSLSNLNQEDKENFPSQIKTFQILETYLEKDILSFLTSRGEIFFYDILSKESITLKLFSSLKKMAQSITINRKRNTLFIIYLYHCNEDRDELKCVEMSFSLIREKIKKKEQFKFSEFTSLLQSESFLPPSFIEYDDYNNILLTKNSFGTIKVLDMENYHERFQLTDKRIAEVRRSEAFILIIKTTNISEKLILEVYDIKNGKNIFDFELNLIAACPLTFFEIFKHVLFLKQEHHKPLFINLLTLEEKILNHDLDENVFFMYANQKNLLLIFQINTVFCYNLKGELVKKIVKDNLIRDISSTDFALTKDKKFLALNWRRFKVNDRNDLTTPKSSLNSSKESILRGSVYSASRSSIPSSSKKKDDNFFDCSLSPISRNASFFRKNEGDNLIGNETYLELNSYNMIDLYDLDCIEEGPKMNIKLKPGYDVIALVISKELMKIFCITVYGDIFEVDL